ncbi:MAG: hypothetical protein A3F84_23250 [Candidatus Handelsmanbacteria bacterium RIFCSPLOWO2_12_FULL_64_10]|uniref:DDH domain-containing protein n=1 Tax=Handelsmanbacteria sp. (strain RIFCSPLOWO2_12_FULL_64_10) TaxID=1817868 RepID=A0A1F6C598_HANXR|nr:MAG: hypothetical protein A3F84_23250 [Candidatus Handelsmanbacteria bacterium RIFCSPLOWO2_12_FULL_64_10]
MPEERGDYCYRPSVSLHEALANSERVFLTAHVDPDPDGLGSVLGLTRILQREGWDAIPVCIGRVPSFAPGLPGNEGLVSFPSRAAERQHLRSIMSPGDTLIVMDTPAASRMAAFYDVHRKILPDSTVINIDHHYTNEAFGRFNFVDPLAAATAEVVCDVLDASGMELDVESASCLMTALVADTQCFRTESTSPRSLLLAHRLWQAGAAIYPIQRLVFGSRALSGHRLWGAALDQMGARDGVVWTCVTEGMLEEASATIEEAEGLVDFLLSSRESKAAIVFKQQGDETKVSVRTIPGVDATKICGVFGGGGHQRASGCTIPSDARGAVAQMIPVALEEVRTGLPRG